MKKIIGEAWRWIMVDQGSSGDTRDSVRISDTKPLAHRLIVIAILCVTTLFLGILVFFGAAGVFTQGSEVVAVLSSAFAVIGTLVGTYFGIKSTSYARTTVEKMHSETAEPLQRAAEQAKSTAQEAAGAAVATRQSAKQAADAAEQMAARTQSPTSLTIRC